MEEFGLAAEELGGEEVASVVQRGATTGGQQLATQAGAEANMSQMMKLAKAMKPVTEINTKMNWKTAAAIGVTGTGGAVIAHQLAKGDAAEAANWVGDKFDKAAAATSAAADAAAKRAAAASKAAEEATRSHYEDAKQQSNSLLESAEQNVHLPHISPGAITGATALTGSVTGLLLTGLVVFVAVEAYRYSRN